MVRLAIRTPSPPMPAGPGVVLSLKTASKGGNTLSTTVHQEHECDLWDGTSAG